MGLGRNEPCHCGSGRKYKKCHYPETKTSASSRTLKYNVQGTFDSPGLPGSHVDISVSPLGLPPKAPFEVVFTLMRSGEPLTKPNVVFSHENLKGDSQILFALPGQPFEPSVEVTLELPNEGKQIVEAISNESGRLAKLRIANIRVETYEAARRLAVRRASYLLSNLSLMHDAPLDVFQTDISDANGNRNLGIRTSFGNSVWDTPLVNNDEISKLSAIYREGLGSSKDLYAFLCFFKIIEAVDGLNVRDLQAARSRGEEVPRRPAHIVPETDDQIRDWVKPLFPGYYRWGTVELSNVAPKEARGTRLTQIRDRHLRPLRIKIAHGLLEAEGLVDVDDPELQDQIKYWLPYTRMMARRLLFSRCLPEILSP